MTTTMMSGNVNKALTQLQSPVQVLIEKLQPSIEAKTSVISDKCISSDYGSPTMPDACDYSSGFSKPPVPLGGLLLVILENTRSKSLTLEDLMHIIYSLFPFYQRTKEDCLLLRLPKIFTIGSYVSHFEVKYLKGIIHGVSLNKTICTKQKVAKLMKVLNAHRRIFRDSLSSPDLLEYLIMKEAALENWIPHKTDQVQCGVPDAINKPIEKDTTFNSGVEEDSKTHEAVMSTGNYENHKQIPPTINSELVIMRPKVNLTRQSPTDGKKISSESDSEICAMTMNLMKQHQEEAVVAQRDKMRPDLSDSSNDQTSFTTQNELWVKSKATGSVKQAYTVVSHSAGSENNLSNKAQHFSSNSNSSEQILERDNAYYQRLYKTKQDLLTLETVKSDQDLETVKSDQDIMIEKEVLLRIKQSKEGLPSNIPFILLQKIHQYATQKSKPPHNDGNSANVEPSKLIQPSSQLPQDSPTTSVEGKGHTSLSFDIENNTVKTLVKNTEGTIAPSNFTGMNIKGNQNKLILMEKLDPKRKECSQSDLVFPEVIDLESPDITNEQSNDLVHDNNQNLPIITSVEDRAFHLWTPSELNYSKDLIDQKQCNLSPVSGGSVSILESQVDILSSSINNENNQIFTCNSEKINSQSSKRSYDKIDTSRDSTRHSVSQTSYSKTSQDNIQNSFITEMTPQVILSPQPLVCVDLKEKSQLPVSCHKESVSHLKPTMLTSSILSPVIQESSTSAQVSIPKISNCLTSWRKVFPWMVFEEASQSFTCNFCHIWDQEQKRLAFVFTIRNPKDVFSVAGHLRTHQEDKRHATLVKVYDDLETLFTAFQCMIMEGFHGKMGIKEIIDDITQHCGSSFPGSLDTNGFMKTDLVSRMIRTVARCIEKQILSALSRSPVFSMVTYDKKGVAIVRWVNQNLEPEEHLICSQISSLGKVMSIHDYLKMKNVDMSRLIGHTPVEKCEILSTLSNKEVPFCYPPLAVCVKCLKYLPVFNQVFTSFDLSAKVFIDFPHWFSDVPEMKIFATKWMHWVKCNYETQIKKDIIHIYFSMASFLKDKCIRIVSATGDRNAAKFCQIQIQRDQYQFVHEIISMLVMVNEAIFNLEKSLPDAFSQVKKLRLLICNKLQYSEKKPPQELQALTILDLYLCHVVMAQSSVNLMGLPVNITKLKLCKLMPVHLEILFPQVSTDLGGGSKECLQHLHKLCKSLPTGANCTLMDILKDLASKSHLHNDFPYLLMLYKRLIVLPLFPIAQGMYMFTLAAHELCYGSIGTVHPFLMMVLLESSQWSNHTTEAALKLWPKSL